MVLIDAGLTTRLEPEDRRNFIAVFHAIIVNDGARVGQLMIDRSASRSCHDPAGFNDTLREIVSEVHREGLSLKHVSVGELLQVRKLLLSVVFSKTNSHAEVAGGVLSAPGEAGGALRVAHPRVVCAGRTG